MEGHKNERMVKSSLIPGPNSQVVFVLYGPSSWQFCEHAGIFPINSLVFLHQLALVSVADNQRTWQLTSSTLHPSSTAFTLLQVSYTISPLLELTYSGSVPRPGIFYSTLPSSHESRTVSFIYLFVFLTFTELLPCARHCKVLWGTGIKHWTGPQDVPQLVERWLLHRTNYRQVWTW